MLQYEEIDISERIDVNLILGAWTVESTPINIREYFKSAYSTDLRFFYYLGHSLKISDLYLYENTTISLVAKIQHFLPYLKTQGKS